MQKKINNGIKDQMKEVILNLTKIKRSMWICKTDVKIKESLMKWVEKRKVRSIKQNIIKRYVPRYI